MMMTEPIGQMMDEVCRDISQQLFIADSKSIDIVLELCNGDIKTMYDIAGRSHIDFNIENPGILESLMYLSYKGREIGN